MDYAFQALAIDEKRLTFPPTIWHKTDDSPAKELQQCWFPGVHGNIGGQADFPPTAGDQGEIGNNTFAWMVSSIYPTCLLHCSWLTELCQSRWTTSPACSPLKRTQSTPSLRSIGWQSTTSPMVGVPGQSWTTSLGYKVPSSDFSDGKTAHLATIQGIRETAPVALRMNSSTLWSESANGRSSLGARRRCTGGLFQSPTKREGGYG